MSAIVEKYIQAWKLENLLKLTSTFTSDVYLSDSRYGKVILKILNEVGVKDELPGTYFLKNMNGSGCVKLHEFDERALLVEYLPGKNLYQYSKVGNEMKASKVFCEIINQMKTCKKRDHWDRFVKVADLFKVFRRIKASNNILELMEEGEDLSRRLLATQNQEVLLHGDLHHENVISRDDGSFACFDPKGLLGDPSYELATTLKNPWAYPHISQNITRFQERAKFFSKELRLPYERITAYAFVHLCLSIAWAIEDNASYAHQLTLAQRLRPIL